MLLRCSDRSMGGTDPDTGPWSIGVSPSALPELQAPIVRSCSSLSSNAALQSFHLVVVCRSQSNPTFTQFLLDAFCPFHVCPVHVNRLPACFLFYITIASCSVSVKSIYSHDYLCLYFASNVTIAEYLGFRFRFGTVNICASTMGNGAYASI